MSSSLITSATKRSSPSTTEAPAAKKQDIKTSASPAASPVAAVETAAPPAAAADSAEAAASAAAAVGTLAGEVSKDNKAAAVSSPPSPRPFSVSHKHLRLTSTPSLYALTFTLRSLPMRAPSST